MTTRPGLLFLTQRLPYPPIKGEKIRQFQILRHLARDFTIDLGCLVDDPADQEHVAALRPFCRDIHAPSLNRRLARLRCLTGLLTGEALSVTFFRHRSLRHWVRTVLRDRRPEVIFVISSNMAPYMLDLSHQGMRIVDLVDVDSEKWRAYADGVGWPMRMVYRREWRKVDALERRIVRTCDHALFVSDAEAAVMAAHLPDAAGRITGISNGVDHRFFDPAHAHPDPWPAGGPVFAFTGTMDYPPNVDAVRWFAAEVLPLIRRNRPDARFGIVGNHPAPAVRALAALPGIIVTGWVADVRPYLAHAAVAVAPMRIARGIQNKVLEAMAMARPTVATSGALEGIEARPGHDLLVADQPEDFAAACLRLSGPDGAAVGRAARRLVLERYDWAARLQPLDTILAPVLDRGPSARPSRPPAPRVGAAS